MRALAAVLALACLAPAIVGRAGAAPSPAPAPVDDREAARRAHAKAEALFRAGDVRGALAAFQAAAAVHPTPVTTFNMALCHERLGELAEAVAQYRAYLAAVPGAPNQAQVEARIAQLEQERAGTQAMRTPELYELPSGPPAGTAPTGGDAEQAPLEDPFWQRIPSRPAGPPPPNAMPDGPYARDAVLHPSLAGGQQPPPNAFAGPTTAAAPGPVGADGADRGAPKAKPLYKEWWFWAIVGVSAVVLYDVATTDDDPPTRTQGATLLSF